MCLRFLVHLVFGLIRFQSDGGNGNIFIDARSIPRINSVNAFDSIVNVRPGQATLSRMWNVAFQGHERVRICC